MPDILSYFSPRKLLSTPAEREMLADESTKFIPKAVADSFEENAFSEYKNKKEDVTDHGANKIGENEIVEEAEIADTCIMNENYDNGYAFDVSSVESLSVALLKLESEKQSLESEISAQYDRITFAEFEKIVARLITVSKIDTLGDDAEDEEVNENFELLKSTALFVEKRLRKVRENIQKKTSVTKVDLNFLTEDHQNHCINYEDEGDNVSINEDVKIETVEDIPESTEELISHHSEDDSSGRSGCSDKIRDEAEATAGSEDNESLTESDKIASDDGDHLSNGNSDIDNKSKHTFGIQKHRWSIRKVIKKKSKPNVQ